MIVPCSVALASFYENMKIFTTQLKTASSPFVGLVHIAKL